MSPPTPATPPRRRAIPAWGLLAASLGVLGLFIVFTRHAAHRAVETEERRRLEVQARAVDENLSLQIIGADRALRDVRADLAAGTVDGQALALSARLRALARAMPAIDSMTVIDDGGRVLASDGSDRVGSDASAHPSLAAARADPGGDLLRVSAPHPGPDGELTVSLSRALHQSDGALAGVVTATLDRRYLGGVLRSVEYAPDMWASLAHADGQALLFVPQTRAAPGRFLALPGSMFSRHRDSGQLATVMRGLVAATGDERLIAQRTLRPIGVALDKPLVLAVSRSVDAIYAPWWRGTAIQAGLYALFAAGICAALVLLHRRQRQIDRLAAEQEARQRDDAERLSLALRGADLALWDMDLRSGTSTVNERWSTMLGWQPGEIGVGVDDWRALLHPEDEARVVALQDDHLAGRSDTYETRYRMRHRDGHWIWVLDRGQVVERAADGRALRMVGTHMDVSAGIEAEQALRRSEQSLATTLNSIGDAVIATDAAGRVERMNPTAERLTGWSLADARGRSLAEVFRIVAARSGEPMLDPVQHVLASGEVVALANDTTLVARDGSQAQIADSAAPIRGPDGVVAGVVLVFSDVTERYRVQQALRDRERQLSAIAGALPGPVSRSDRDGRYLFANAAYERWFGVPAAEVVGRTQREVLGERRYASVEAHVERVLAGETVQYESPVATAQIGRRHVLVTLVPDFDEEGRMCGHFTIVTDITDRRAAEDQLLAAQRELRATLEAVPDLLFEVSLDGTVHRFHSPRSDLWLVPPQDFIGRRFSTVLPPAAAAVIDEALQEADRSGHSIGRQYELPLRDGARWFELSVSRKPVDEGQSPRFIALARDITERVHAERERQALERQLRESQKMESIGTLAGGVAHDFNNILAAILGNTELARQDAGADDAVQLSLEQIHKAALRARNLVQQIMAFSRREASERVVQPLRPVVEETLALLRATLPAGVQLDARLPDMPVPVRADATQLQQVLMNLATNAWHALPDGGGRIEIGFENLPASADPVFDASVHLWVRDNGAGMDDATRARIFDPFFTTKPVGRGTGLGLSVVHGIVRAHEGRIVVDSAPGQGSCFHLYFPAPPTATPLVPAAHASPSRASGVGEQVLYVDDDDVMLMMVERLLERAGYRVSTCHDAAEALVAVQARPFDIVVTDHNMPGMSGLELARRLRRLRPELPLILSSGFLPEELRDEARQAGVRWLLKKENTVEELTALVKTALGH